MKKKKKLLITIIIIITILVIAVAVILGHFIKNDLTMENDLTKEVTEINLLIENNSKDTSIDKRLNTINTSGDYMLVEKAAKRYLKDKENNARKYAQLRDCMLDAIKFNEAEGKDIVEILKPLIEQFDFLLEQEGVRILKAKVKEKFNPEIHRPVSRVEVHHKRHNGKIAKVYNEGYWLEGQPAPFQKVMVAVCVYTPQYDFED